MDKFINQISGIYKISCKNNGKFYIGSSINIERRLKQHKRLLIKNKHPNKYLQNCWNKYGEKNFRYEIIETINDISQIPTREKWWLDNTKCYKKEIGFNISFDFRIDNGRKFIDLTGKKFNYLTVQKYIGKTKMGTPKWLCKCDCGKGKTIQEDNLKNGSTKSCGCWRKKRIISANIKNSIHKHTNTYTYSVHKAILSRCNNPNSQAYKYYGGRIPPITICDRWNPKKGGSFKNFLEDIGEIPKGLILGRINTNKGYFPGNCELSTRKKQQRKRKNTRFIFIKNIKIPISEVAEKHNISTDVLAHRIYDLGWPIKKALITPVKKYKRRKNK